MLTVMKVTDFRWTGSQRVQSNSLTSIREAFANFYRHSVASKQSRELTLSFYQSRELVVVSPIRGNLATYLLYLRVLARLGSFFEPCFSLPPLPVPTVQNRPMEYSQVVRHRFLVPACKGSNPFTPDYEHPIRMPRKYREAFLLKYFLQRVKNLSTGQLSGLKEDKTFMFHIESSEVRST